MVIYGRSLLAVALKFCWSPFIFHQTRNLFISKFESTWHRFISYFNVKKLGVWTEIFSYSNWQLDTLTTAGEQVHCPESADLTRRLWILWADKVIRWSISIVINGGLSPSDFWWRWFQISVTEKNFCVQRSETSATGNRSRLQLTQCATQTTCLKI